jgi:hypothetical protein
VFEIEDALRTIQGVLFGAFWYLVNWENGHEYIDEEIK